MIVRSYIFFSFLTQKGANLRLSRPGMTSNFPSRMLFLPNGLTPVTNNYLTEPKMKNRTKNACYTSLFLLLLTLEAT